MFNIQRILIFLFATIAIFYLAMEVGEGSFGTASLVLIVSVGGAVYLWLDKNIWLLIPVALINPISLAFLPVPFKAVEVAFLLIGFYMIFSHAAMKHQGFALGPANIWVPVMIILVIIAYHQGSGGLGLRAFGSDSAGARRHATFFIGFAFYVTMVSVWPKVWKWVLRTPGFYLVALLAGAIPNLFCIYFPGAAMAMGIFWIFAGIGDVIYYYLSDVQRVGLWGPLGLALQLWLVSRYPINTWFNASRLIGLVGGLIVGTLGYLTFKAIGDSGEGMAQVRLVLMALVFVCGMVVAAICRDRLVLFLSFLALLACANSGFRGSMVQYFIISAVAAILSLRWRVMVFVLPVVAVVAALVLGHGILFQLPEAAQRSLSFIPGGRWDPDVEASAGSSIEFRRQIRDLYLERYAMNSPWVGNGYKMATRDVGSGMLGERVLGAASEEIEGYIRSKDFHTGWLSMYDSVGLLGSAAFVWLCVYLMVYLLKKTRRIGWDRLAPVQIWVTCFVIDAIVSFFTVFGSMADIMPTLLFGAGLAVVVFEQLPAAELKQPQEIASTVEPKISSPALRPALVRTQI